MHKLLVVDDSNIIRRKIARSQASSSFDIVGSAENGKQALEMFQSNLPDVVTMDLTMPEMDGIECIEKIMQIKPDVNILVVSALSDKATGLQAIKKGARGFLCKPFKDEELISALNRMMEA
ncbi:MAG: response regulator [Pseudomonadales bacterium]|nr:response regulator [Pseudomonadales bacterium]